LSDEVGICLVSGSNTWPMKMEHEAKFDGSEMLSWMVLI